MDEDSSGSPPHRFRLTTQQRLACLIATGAIVLLATHAAQGLGTATHPTVAAQHLAAVGPQAAAPSAAAADADPIFTTPVIIATLLLVVLSAYFSSCEVAFFSLHALRLRAMQESPRTLDRMAARLMQHPGDLLTSILTGNSIVNVLLGVVLAARLAEFLEQRLPPAAAYALAVALGAGVLVFFGEVMPKLIAVRRAELFARYAAPSLYCFERLLSPLRKAVILFIGFLFRVTRFSEVRPAPFMTDEEFLSLLSEGEAAGAIEEDERAMIQGILEFGDAAVREILVPRPDMVVLAESAIIGEALELIRKHEFARMPVYRGHIDQITGVLYAKDLLPAVDEGALDQPILPLVRQVHFVPETISVADFVKTSQRLRTHLAIVVDEYGGTEGLVTLQDALREVVGNIGEEEPAEEPACEEVRPGVFSVPGSYPLDDLEALTGVKVQDEVHTTVAGFLMAKSDKILEAGDEIEHEGAHYSIEKVEGKRVAKIHIHLAQYTTADTREANDAGGASVQAQGGKQ